MQPVAIERVGADGIDRVRRLWLDLLSHHATLNVDREVQSPARSWAVRRQVYEGVLQHPDAFMLVAASNGDDVGYAVVAIHPGPDDTWVTGDRIAEVETLSVAPKVRGSGVGTMLLDQVDLELDRRHIHDLRISVVTSNARAIEFYRRRGLTPHLTSLSRTRTSRDR